MLTENWLFARGTLDAPAEVFQPVRIPHDWAIVDTAPEYVPMGESQGFFTRRGIGWYRNTFSYRKMPGMRTFLNFDGVMENSTVWVNGNEAGGHGWGYTPFRLDVTEYMQSGENTIEVRCDCSVTPPDRWYSGCGLYRPVSLLTVPDVHLDDRKVVLHTELSEGAACLQIRTGLDAPVTAQLYLRGSLKAEGMGREDLTLHVMRPELWSAETPVLYDLVLSLVDGSDRIGMRVGLREVSVNLDGIRVNGKKVYLRGVCLHQDIPCVGIAATPDLWRSRLEQLRSIGVNALRCAHHVHSAAFMDLCDEMGFYVYEEFTDKWHSGSYNRYFDQWQSDVDAMMDRDRNRPSVIIWGAGNEVENQAQPSMMETLRMLTQYMRAKDPSRPVSYAMNPHFKRPSGRDASRVKDIQKLVDEADEYEIEDLDERVACICRIAEHVDIISCNYQEQWFEAIHRACPDKPILATEVYQFFMGHEKNMQNFTMGDIPVAFGEKTPYCLGSFIWVGYDYLGESHGWPGKGSTSGIFRSNGVPRFAAHILRSLWKKEPYIHIGVLDYSFPDEIIKEHWATPPYEDGWDFRNVGRQVFPFMAATNCEEITVEYGDRTLFFAMPKNGPSGYLTGFVPFVPGTLRATGYIGGRAVCAHELHTPGKPACLRFTDAPVSLPAERNRRILLTVQAEDMQGVHVIRALDDVAFSVSGPAEIEAVDNGDSLCGLPFTTCHVPLFRGRASVLLRLSGEPGAIRLQAEAGGGFGGSAEIRTE